MKIGIIKLSRGYHRSKGWTAAYLRATVDGHLVQCTGNGRGWTCDCGDDDCDHLNTVADLIDKEVLEELELDDDHHLREARHPQNQQPRERRRKRVPR